MKAQALTLILHQSSSVVLGPESQSFDICPGKNLDKISVHGIFASESKSIN